MPSQHILDRIEEAFSQEDAQPTKRQAVEELLNALELGLIRAAHPHNDGWMVDTRVKQGILRAFSVGIPNEEYCGPLSFVDKDNLWPRRFSKHDGIRIVPGGTSVRRGVFLGKNVVVMPPSYINIGAYIDEGSMIDSHALVGSCAQVGKRVHISAAAQVGGVLEPVGALPVIIEDDVLIGGNCGLYEGVRIGHGAVLGAGVILTKSSKVFDLVHERVLQATYDASLCIPNNAVVVMGSRMLEHSFAKHHGLSVATPLIIKYRDEKTDAKTALEQALR